MRCSPPPPPVTHKIDGRQSIPVNWGYDCHEEDAPEVKSYRRTLSDPSRHYENDLNLPGTAFKEPQPSFIRYGNPAKLLPHGPQTPNHACPCPITEYKQPIPKKPQPRVIIQPPVQQRPSVLVQLGGKLVNGLVKGVGVELAKQARDGVDQPVRGALRNF